VEKEYMADHQGCDEIKLGDLIQILWRYKLFIIIFTGLCSVLAVVYAINKPNEYTSEGLYMPKGANASGSLSKLASQFGGLASLAGINLGGSGEDKTEVAIELLKSRAFLQGFIERHRLLPLLLAVEEWDSESNSLIYDSDIYDIETGKWVREAPVGKQVVPTAWEGYENLKESIDIEFEPKKGILKIQLTYYSPEIAASWLTMLVSELNDFWQIKKLNEIERYIDAIAQKADETKQSEIKEVLYSLIAEQTKSSLLTQVTEEAMFETVADIVIPEEKSAPSRALLCIVAFVFSGMLSSVIVLLYGVSKRRKELYG